MKLFLKRILQASGAVAPFFVQAQGGGIENPLGNTSTITGLLIQVIQFLLGLVGVLALLALIIGGVRIILAFGSEDKLRDGKKIIWWAIVGLIVVIASFAIIRLVAVEILGVQL